jgi:hypothetical protein
MGVRGKNRYSSKAQESVTIRTTSPARNQRQSAGSEKSLARTKPWTQEWGFKPEFVFLMKTGLSIERLYPGPPKSEKTTRRL